MSLLTDVPDSTLSHPFDPPCRWQLAALRRQADALEETFVYPQTAEQAAEEMKRMAGRARYDDSPLWLEECAS